MKSNVSISPQVLLHHVVSGMAVTRDMITNDALVPTVEGSIHRVNVYLKSDYYDVRSLEALCPNSLTLASHPGFCDGQRKADQDV